LLWWRWDIHKPEEFHLYFVDVDSGGYTAAVRDRETRGIARWLA
jgi:hypothetical protein